MWGEGTGSLNVYTNISNRATLLWSQSGNKGNQWLNAQVSVKSAATFRLVIEAIRGRDHRSDIAIDDLDFVERPCKIFPYDASPFDDLKTTTMQPTRTLRPISQFDCNFETDMCIWSPTAESSFNWTRAQGVKGSQLVGPIEFDNTLGTSNGWYLFANLANKKFTDMAIIESRQISGAKCMEFYYYLFANSKFVFNVYIEIFGQVSYPIWKRSDSQGDFWRLGKKPNSKKSIKSIAARY